LAGQTWAVFIKQVAFGPIDLGCGRRGLSEGRWLGQSLYPQMSRATSRSEACLIDLSTSYLVQSSRLRGSNA
jgi:hypothetical protein